MDAKRFTDPRDIANFREYLSWKLSRLPHYDLIIAVDDEALQFVMDERASLFPGIPVVFLGINDSRRAERALRDGKMTGTVENLSIGETVHLALSFEPPAKHVVAVVDDTMAGQGEQLQFMKTSIDFPDLRFSFLDASVVPRDEMMTRLASYGDDTILLYLSMFADSSGAPYSIDEAARFLSKFAKTPVYRPAIGGLGQGLLGGSQISYREYGKIAARQVLSIVTGTPVSKVKPMMTSLQTTVLDAKVMKRFGIPEKLAPKDTTFINRKQGFFERNRETLLPSGFIVGFLLIVVAVAVADSMRQRKIEKSLQESEARYRELATRDPLTGLHNRSALQSWIEEQTEKSAADGGTGKGAVFYLDLDNFKNINDAYGHDTGDDILTILGKRLATLEEPGICASRIGGDEFVIAVWKENLNEEIGDLIHRIHLRLEENYVLGERTFYLTASAGIAWYPEHGDTYRELLRNVDAALYRAKAQGKDQYVFFSRDMQEDMLRRSELQQGLRQALLEDALIVHFQPQFSLSDGKIIGYEALVRWNHREQGLLLPGAFIEAAEDAGIISRIGTRVFELACKFSNLREAAGLEPIKISVNVSAKQLQELLFCSMVKKRVEKYGVKSENIMLEITESALIGQMEQAKERLQTLREMGFGVCLDDFGTGFSSLSYLRQLPFDVLKIDRSFVVDIDTATDKKNLTEDIIRIAHKLGMEVIAEGVERAAQMEILASLRCNSVQGFLTGRPMPPEDAIARELGTKA